MLVPIRHRISGLSYVTIFTVLCLVVLFNLSTNFPNGVYKNSFRAVFEEDLTVASAPISEVMKGDSIKLPQDDKRIMKYIWDNFLIESPSDAPYNLQRPDKDPSMGQGQFIRKILKNMTNGFFIEAGALEGEIRSNTLFMEQHLGWKGLLVEGDPKNYAQMKIKNRKAWTSKTCLAVKPYPHQANYLQSFNLGKITDVGPPKQNNKKHYRKHGNPSIAIVQCIPVFSLLSALNVTTVDYFSLDVEGSELQVLKTIPFDKVFIKTLSVEFTHTTEGKQNLLEYMLSEGYKNVGEVLHPGSLANDFIFVHKNVNIT